MGNTRLRYPLLSGGELYGNDVHVWTASLQVPTDDFQNLAELLPLDERIKAEQFRFEQDRKRFVVRRALLRSILSFYTKIKPIEIRFSHNQYGKPELVQPNAKYKLYFSTSHSRALALYAITWDRRIGVDIERNAYISESEAIVARYFPFHEKKLFDSSSEENKQEVFFICWTCIESYLKAIGEGLTHQITEISSPLVPEEVTSTGLSAYTEIGHINWSIRGFQPIPDYTASVVVEGSISRLLHLNWPYVDY